MGQYCSVAGADLVLIAAVAGSVQAGIDPATGDYVLRCRSEFAPMSLARWPRSYLQRQATIPQYVAAAIQVVAAECMKYFARHEVGERLGMEIPPELPVIQEPEPDPDEDGPPPEPGFSIQ